MIMPLPASSKTINTITADQANTLPAGPAGNRLVLMGFSCKESAGIPAAATFTIQNAAAVDTAKILAHVNLTASQSTREWWGPGGIDADNGITIDFLTGQFDITIWYIYAQDV